MSTSLRSYWPLDQSSLGPILTSATISSRDENCSVASKFVPIVVDFVLMTASISLQTRNLKVSVQRLSTPSYVTGQEDNFTQLTQWCWYFDAGFGNWLPYEPESLQYTLELKYLAGQPFYNFETDQFQYEISFSEMTQTNLKTLKQRRLQRRPAFVSIDDVQRQKILYHPCLSSKKAVYSATLPDTWWPLDCYQPVEMVKLDFDGFIKDEEMKTVMKLFFSTMNKSKVILKYLFRIQNLQLWKKYCSMREVMLMNRDDEGDINERFLFHGTSDDVSVIRGICHNNIDFRLNGKHGTSYGKGAYFARDAKYSHCYTTGSLRYIFISKVLVGQYAKGESSYCRPPSRKGHVLYDSCVDDVKNPSIFVIFDTYQSYPAFLLEYSVKTRPELSSSSTSVPVLQTSTPTRNIQMHTSVSSTASIQQPFHSSTSAVNTSNNSPVFQSSASSANASNTTLRFHTSASTVNTSNNSPVFQSSASTVNTQNRKPTFHSFISNTPSSSASGNSSSTDTGNKSK